MSIILRPTKQPADDLDYTFDFTAWLADKADTIASFTVTSAVYDAGVYVGTPAALVLHGLSRNLGAVTCFAAGGTHGVKYEITCTITTASTPPRVKQDEMVMSVKET